MKFKKGDEVKITAGKDRGKTGKIERVFAKENKVFITGINMYKKHLKTQGQGKPGGIIDVVRPLSIANIALVCPHCKKQTRAGFVINKKEKNRICRKCKGVLK